MQCANRPERLREIVASHKPVTCQKRLLTVAVRELAVQCGCLLMVTSHEPAFFVDFVSEVVGEICGLVFPQTKGCGVLVLRDRLRNFTLLT